ncbi:MAG: ABC transporter permease [Chitinophagaceae bacterium]
MHKIWLVLRREYLSRVKKKTFLLLTILVPLIIIGFYAAIIAIAVSGHNEKEKVAVIDKANLFDGKSFTSNGLTFEFIPNETEESYREKYRDLGYKYFLSVPPANYIDSSGTRPTLYYAKNLGPGTQSKLESAVDEAVRKKRMHTANISEAQINSFKVDIGLKTLKGKGDQAEVNAGVNSGVGFTAGFMVYLMLIIYGTMVMRGVMEEKTSRIAEVIVSSVKPFQLMLGKIIGIGAVGLTQFLIWVFLVIGLQYIIPFIFPEFGSQLQQASAGGGMQGGGMIGIINSLKSLPIGNILFTFTFYFLGGYFMYAALFASVGSMVNEDPQEAQQMIFPITMPILLSFVIMTQAINQPDSDLAIFGSLFPLTSPIVMMGRISYGVPGWQLALSMFLLVLTFLGTTWLAAKIYRTGILMYGKKPSWKEMIRWAFRKG